MMYIINNAIADRLVQSLDPGEHHVPHLELGPGPGVLTRRLLSAGVRHITCFEPAAAFRSSVLELQEETGGAVRLTPLNLLQLPKMWGAATHGQEARLQQALDGLSWRPWHQGPCLRVVGVAHRSTFFRYLVRTVVEREHLFQFGRPELVVYVPSSEVERLTSSPDMSGRAYRPYSILSQIFFRPGAAAPGPGQTLLPLDDGAQAGVLHRHGHGADPVHAQGGPRPAGLGAAQPRLLHPPLHRLEEEAYRPAA
ncbi:dimethyladenosine transferase 2, mitochondrial-like [Pollicipes pollicipes]|uniref:dimethyladenosine transferase 2, mitochondrial-like n=1 Tax=Pollicipes pollicipes TaxID=41117 RepID=UPI001884ACE0|nr:dimethyladenosine transferase 2, mitochondrial-like [Pollicipes pollicipes]